MTMENSGTTACPHCGGEIKAAARVCKHCKRLLPGGDTQPAASGTASPTAAIRDDLRAYVIARGVVRREQIDAMLAQHVDPDAAVLLGHLAAAGYITPVQVESLREGFRAQQESRAVGVLRVAQERGLLTPAHVEQALAGYRVALFQQTIGEYLTTAGFLTAVQAEELQRSTSIAGQFVVSSRSWWRGLSQTSRRVVYGLVGLFLVWIVVAFVAAVVESVRGHADIDESATMNGWGHGTATFTNRGRREGSLCGHVYVSCGQGSRSSASFCSGTVTPNETKHVDFSVPGMDRIGSMGRDWRDDCTFDFIRESTGD